MIVYPNMNKFLWGYSNMVTITLYKNCKLNNSYQEVFANGSISQSGKSLIDEYLDSLVKFSFTINDYYYENNGELIIDSNIINLPNIHKPYDFNYMKVLDDSIVNGLKKYCFINSISLKNGCHYIKYEEDIWASYSDKIYGILPSYLSRSRVKNYQNFTPSLKMLPKEYESNDKLWYNSIFVEDNASVSRRVYLWVEIQLYDLVSGTDNKSIRSSFFYLVHDSSNPNTKTLTINIAYEYIRRMILQMPDNKINNHNYQIGKIMIMPEYFFNNIDNFIDNVYYDYALLGDDVSGGTIGARLHRIDRTSYALDTDLIIKTITINNNYKNISIGTFDNQIKINNNGTSFNVSLIMTRTNSNINLKLSVLNTIIDITDSFLYEPPLTAILAEDFAQRKIATELESYKVSMKKSQTLTSGTINNVLDIGNAISNLILGANTGRYGGLMNESRNIQSAYGDILDKWIYDRNILNKINESITAPKYSNTKGNITNISGMQNYVYGIVLFRIVPENANFVKKCVDNFGYEVFEFLDNIENLQLNEPTYFINNNIKYNVIKFETVNVYGSFTKEIASILNSILLNGVKILFTYESIDDNYTNDLL